MTTTPERSLPSAASYPDEPLPSILARLAETRTDERAVTFVDYREQDDGVPISLTWRELDARVDAVAAWCQRHAQRGDRAAVLVEQSVDYVVAFLGVLRAGLVAVPLFEPNPLPGHADRLAAVLADCDPALVLTTRAHADPVDAFLAERGLDDPRLLAVDVLPHGERPAPAEFRPDDLAYLQYTSGSTRDPAGVMITHGNVSANARQSVRAYAPRPDTTVVSWLPLFHDMGLVAGIAAPLYGGLSSVLLDPLAFLARPQRWLEQLAAVPGTALSCGPNFAFGYVAARTSAEEKARLRLDHVLTFGDGSEPVLPATLDAFYSTFAECGLTPVTHQPGYGLAEAVVMVSLSPRETPPKLRAFDRVSLAAGRAVPVEPGTASSSTLVSAGPPIDQRVRIADRHTATALPDGRVGEIWVSGPNVGIGYWGKETESAAVFAAQLSDADGRRIEPYPGRKGWLRTGDLGMMLDGELYVTGRLKDLIIVDGRNHYPQDIEVSVEGAHPSVRRHAVAAFSVPGEHGELAVVVAERARQVPAGELDRDELAAAVRSVVSAEHGLALADVLMVEPGEIPRTSSGKIRRSACRVRYLEGSLCCPQ